MAHLKINHKHFYLTVFYLDSFIEYLSIIWISFIQRLDEPELDLPFAPAKRDGRPYTRSWGLTSSSLHQWHHLLAISHHVLNALMDYRFETALLTPVVSSKFQSPSRLRKFWRVWGPRWVQNAFFTLTAWILCTAKLRFFFIYLIKLYQSLFSILKIMTDIYISLLFFLIFQILNKCSIKPIFEQNCFR